jgi:hypothetical protein
MDLDCEVFFPSFFPGTFLDLPAGILYTIIVSLGPDMSVVKLEFLGYHFGPDSRMFGSSF